MHVLTEDGPKPVFLERCPVCGKQRRAYKNVDGYTEFVMHRMPEPAHGETACRDGQGSMEVVP